MGQLCGKTAVLAAALLASSARQHEVYGYEFCDDTMNGIASAFTIASYCPMQFEHTKIQVEHMVQPSSLTNGLKSWHSDCASALIDHSCTCFNRARSSLQHYFFTMGSQPLIAEEVTICAIKHLFMTPAPISMLQIQPAMCNVTYVSEHKFTVICDRYKSCCIFKIIGTNYFWHSPGCSRR